jgi:Ca2+:H+ antiporter
VLICIYAAGLIFSLVTHKNLFGAMEHRPPRLSKASAVTVLLAATALVAWLSEIFVGAIEPATHALGMSPLFVGVMVVAIIGNAAEHAAAVMLARKNQMDLALGVSIGSSVQIALLVAPLLVLCAPLLGQHLSLLFNPFEIAAVVLSVLVVTMVVLDGETTWFEGLQLLGLYTILALAFYFIPA